MDMHHLLSITRTDWLRKSVPQKHVTHNWRLQLLSNSKQIETIAATSIYNQAVILPRPDAMDFQTLQPLLEHAIAARSEMAGASRVTLGDPSHESAFRLFNGFNEGWPDLVMDVFGLTLVVYNHLEDPAKHVSVFRNAIDFVQDRLNWLRAGVLKIRNSNTREEERGKLIFGDTLDTRIREDGIRYAIDLTMNRDASFYLDTRNLRKWLKENMHERTVLNTFAYTGSFGVAALAGKARRVIQVDKSRKFLELAMRSCVFNGFTCSTQDLIAQDFFPAVARFKRTRQFFDCVILDPPFFSSTRGGRVDQVNESARLINKVRPLINDGGWLVAVNNALFVSGSEYMQTLEALRTDGYLRIEELLPVPQDYIGLNRLGRPLTDPAPFNHSTKIAVLRVRRKS
jgi:23S rRNA (cytosine1962-C5)-methyltransferase